MTTGIAVFAYNRNIHLLRVLDGLKKNLGIKNIYIFQDGLKCEDHRANWEKTKKVIEEIDWCEKKYILSTENKGLAKSIVSGINLVMEENDTVIVLEDDCVPAPNFVAFMTQCFEKYKDNKRVYSVSGFSWPIDLPESDSDIYFCGRVSSWGWGTWKDRWKQYNIDYMAVKKLQDNKELSKRLAQWGKDLDNMLTDNIRGENDSWAVFWALNVIQNNGVCINPYRSLIRNIGMDGTGRHCGVTNRFDVAVDMDSHNKLFKLPDKVSVFDTTLEAFVELYGSYTAVDYKKMNTKSETVLVYGIGNFFFTYEKEINQNFNIVSFLDKNKHGWFAGKKIIKPVEVVTIEFDRLLIAVQSIQQCINISQMLINQYGVNNEKIELLHNLYGKYSECFDDIYILTDGNLRITARGISVKVCSEVEFIHAYDVLVNE